MICKNGGTIPLVFCLAAILLGGCGGGGGNGGGGTTGGDGSGGGGGGTPATKSVLVRLQPGESIEAVARDYGATVEASSPEDNLYRLRSGDDSLAARLAADVRSAGAESDDGVRSPEAAQTVTGDPIHVPFDFVGKGSARFAAIALTFSGAGGPTSPAATGDPGIPFRQVNLDPAFAVTRGAGVIVAVLDTGVQADHPSLQAHLLPGYNAIAPGSLPDDVPDGTRNEAFGHGTMVAGIIARMAPEAKILPVRVMNADGSGSLFNVVRGLHWAVANHARVINLSLGTTESSGILREAISDAREAGAVIVSSAGNAGGDVRDFPAGFSETVSVAAVDDRDQKAPFSNFGSHIRLAAPGTAIVSTFPGGDFAAWSGTSFASPFVAGAAALVCAVNPGADPDKIASDLADTTRRLGNSLKIGSGVLDTGAAVNATVH